MAIPSADDALMKYRSEHSMRMIWLRPADRHIETALVDQAVEKLSL